MPSCKNILKKTVVTLSLIVALSLAAYPQGSSTRNRAFFVKCGAKSNPCLIKNRKDLEKFRDKVNKGKSFKDHYFLQTSDIDLQNAAWIPVGISDSKKYFHGTYDGNGHVIRNLNVSFPSGTVGLFGVLSGTVRNLGIESGTIAGDRAGSVAGRSDGDKAALINCYNKANVTGKSRAGGIADDFSGGTIVNCVNAGKVEAPVRGEIVSYDAANIIAVHSENPAFPKTFTGGYIEYNSSKTTVTDKLNDGIFRLISEKVVDRSAVKKWR